MTTVQRTNGVDTTTLFASIDAVKVAPAAAQFLFRASNRWMSGPHVRSTIDRAVGGGEEQSDEQPTTLDVEAPAG